MKPLLLGSLGIVFALQLGPEVVPDTTLVWGPVGVGYVVTILGAAIGAVIGAWKLAKIEAHVNSKDTSYREQLIARDREIALLRESLEREMHTAALLAQAQVHLATPAPPTPLLDPAPAPVPVAVTVVNSPSKPVHVKPPADK